MFNKRMLHLTLLASFMLLGTSKAKFSHLNQLKENRRMKYEAYFGDQYADVEPASNSSYRYLNNCTEKYLIESLPAVRFTLPEMYSGNIPIDENVPNRTLFFVFQPREGDPVDEITIWLNGGPGCSSLAGFFQENGRFLWTPGAYAPYRNPHSWTTLTNMLWVEQPVGTGFSTGKVEIDDEEGLAQEFLGFFKNFQKTFGIKDYKIYVTGESYAGRYIPYISSAMIDAKNKTYYDISGALIYDGVIGDYTYTQEDVTIVPFVLENKKLFGFDEPFLENIKGLYKTCGFEDLVTDHLIFPPKNHQPRQRYRSVECTLWITVDDEASAINPCLNEYEIVQQCPPIGDPLSNRIKYFDDPSLPPTVYFNRPDVKKAMHAPENVRWTECGGAGFRHGDDKSPDPIQGVLPKVIEATNRVLIANGDNDMIIITQGTLLAIQNMTWNGKLGFQEKPSTPIILAVQGNMGIQHYERGLMWAETFMAGHMGPEYQPQSSLLHLEWVLGRRDTL